MSFDNSTFNLLLSNLIEDLSVEDKFKLIGEKIKNQIFFTSLGIFLKIPNMELFQCRYSINLSEKFTTNTIFTVGDPLIQDLSNFRTIDIKFPGQYVFEHEYAHLIIIPVKFNKKLYGFVFMDKEDGIFRKDEIAELEIYASIISMLVKISFLEEILIQHNEMFEYYRIYNRKAFLEKSTMYFKMLKRYNRYLSLAVFRLGNFKNFLRFHSKEKANILLKDICTTFQSDLRQSDLVGILSRDEVAILLPETSAENAILTINRLRKKIDNLDNLHNFKTGWGIRVLNDSDETMNELLTHAEKAAAKSMNKNKPEIIIL